MINRPHCNGSRLDRTSTLTFPTLDDAIAILPDNDAEGRAYAKTVAAILTRLSPPAKVRTVMDSRCPS